MKFRSDVDGFVTGIRFYKGSQNTGTHVGSLWTTSGQRLATATFTNETTSGWQEVTFALAGRDHGEHHLRRLLPHHLRATTPGTTTTSPPRASTTRRCTPWPRACRRQRGLRLRRHVRRFPQQFLASSNYWVDVTFTTSTGPDTTPPVVTVDLADGQRHGRRHEHPGRRDLQRGPRSGDCLDPDRDPHRAGGTAVAAQVTYDAGTRSVVHPADVDLSPSTTYTARLKGGNGRSRGSRTSLATPWPRTRSGASRPPSAGPCDDPANEIVAENCRAGNPASEWDITGAG